MNIFRSHPFSQVPFRTHARPFAAFVILTLLGVLAPLSPASAQPVLFDFDSASLHSSFPVDQTAGGITAHLTAPDPGYSIQDANVLGFTPQGFAGRIIYPNSIFRTDLFIRFDQPLVQFAIMYACQELGCDDAATMRVTAYSNGNLVGTNTMTARAPGTWPVDTLSCAFAQGFDSVVIHYDSPPPTCRDYGVIFVADNMMVTPSGATGVSEGGRPATFSLRQNYPNPFNPSTTIHFELPTQSHVRLVLYDLLGREVARLIDAQKPAGGYDVPIDGSMLPSGVYFYRLQAGGLVQTRTMVSMK